MSYTTADIFSSSLASICLFYSMPLFQNGRICTDNRNTDMSSSHNVNWIKTPSTASHQSFVFFMLWGKKMLKDFEWNWTMGFFCGGGLETFEREEKPNTAFLLPPPPKTDSTGKYLKSQGFFSSPSASYLNQNVLDKLWLNG